MDVGSFVLGSLTGPIVWLTFKVTRRSVPKVPKEPPKPLLPRDVGDVLVHRRSGLPVMLLERLTEGRFRGCFITPRARELGATVGNEHNPMNELDPILVSEVNSREHWPDYAHKLSDGEHANYTKAMLDDKGK